MENQTDTTAAESAPGLGSACPRIYTSCPACHNDTLTVNDGHLLCTWHECPDPTLIDRIGAPGTHPPCADDTHRLNWLERNGVSIGYNVELSVWGVDYEAPYGKTIREGIDAARCSLSPNT